MTLASDHARIAYDALAPHYDAFTAHHDYEAWTADLERLAIAADLRGRRLLDVACGTGKSFLPFLARGYDVTACDVSPVMARTARIKAGGRVDVHVHDMRSLPVLGAFDLVCCLDDAVNYLEANELAAAIAGMRANLAPGGVLVFDVNSLVTFRRLYSSILVVPGPNRVIMLEGRGAPDLPSGGRAHALIDALERRDDGWWERTRTVHHHSHHPEPVIRAALADAGLSVVRIAGLHIDGRFTDQFDDLEHSKAVYIAREERR